MTTRAHRRPSRVLALLTLTAPMAAMLVTGTAGPAHAATVAWGCGSNPPAGCVPPPADGSIIVSGSSIPGAFTVGSGSRGQIVMTIRPPASTNLSDRTTSLASCTQSLTQSCPGKTMWDSFPLTSSGAPLSNGAWSLSLTGQTTRTAYTNLPPTQTPAGLTAQGTGRSQVDLSWTYGGQEKDLWGFRIEDDHSNSVQVSRSDVGCGSDDSCSYSNASWDDNAEPGTYTYSFTVTALRLGGGCNSCGQYTESSKSTSATTQLVTPQPPPSPTPSPTGGTTGGTTGDTTGASTGGTTGGTSGGSTGGTTTGGSSTGGTTTGSHSGGSTGTKATPKPIAVPTLPPLLASRRAFALGFNKFSPSLGIPKLPPLPATTFPTTASGNETYQPTLPYKNEPKKTTNVLSSPIASIKNSIGLDTEQLMTFLAIGLILLASAAHVRVFLSRSVDD